MSINLQHPSETTFGSWMQVKLTKRHPHLSWQWTKGPHYSRVLIGACLLSWSGWQAALLPTSAPPWLEGNYRDKNLDSEGNMPAFQRSRYQDGVEQQPWDCTVSPSVVYFFFAKDSACQGPNLALSYSEQRIGLNFATSHRTVTFWRFAPSHLCLTELNLLFYPGEKKKLFSSGTAPRSKCLSIHLDTFLN